MTTGKILRPDDLKKISEDREMAKIREYEAKKQKQEGEAKELYDAFMGREIHPEVMNRVNAAISRAAEQGNHQTQALVFPATYCNDRGRRINNYEPDWPDSLEGFAKRAYDFFVKELQPLGYKIRAEVLDYHDGTPGNVGLFLVW